MSVLAWIRKSKGSEDDIGLEEQREKVHQLAEELSGGEYDVLDLGVQTGFSSMTRDGDGLLDHHPEVQAAVDAIESGDYDYLVALDDRRICRDDYLSVIEYAANQGGCEFAYVGDVEEDDLAYDIHRRVERETKEEEMRKSKAAVRRRQEKGFYQGRPPMGLKLDDEKQYLVPDEEFDVVCEVLDLLDRGTGYRKIKEQTDVPLATISRIKGRRELYERHREPAAKNI